MSFDAFGLDPQLRRAVADLGFAQPTPIQRDAIPPALARRDVLACAMTGSGKTAAFLLPILHQLLGRPRGVTRALVLSPTRELAAQTAEHLRELARHTPLRGAAVYGGVGMAPQEQAFRRGVDVLVATPGRLLDHFQQPYARLEGIEYLVLDEADRMLDMGFLPDVRRVLRHLDAGNAGAKGGAKRRQTFFFSATLPPPIVQLSRELLLTPAAINIERPAAPAHGITQAVYPVREELKRYLLLELLRRDAIRSAIVFTRTKHRANRLADFLDKHGVDCERLHGNRSQRQRTEALAAFKSGASRVLVATDIAARGIDIEALSHVINFDVPHLPDDYIHRVGRTARVAATGDAFTFVSEAEREGLRAIERAVGRRLPVVELAGFDYRGQPSERFEVPLAERIATIRARKAGERQRAQLNAARKAPRGPGQPSQRRAPAAGQRLHRERQGSVSDTPPAAGAHLGSHLGPAFSSRPRIAGRAGGRPGQRAARGPARRRLR